MTNKWEFLLKKGERRVLDLEVEPKEMAEALSNTGVEGYIFDDKCLIPVREIVFGRRFEEEDK